MDVARESFDATFSNLINRFLANAWRKYEFRERTYNCACYEITLFRKLVSRAEKIIYINERSFSDLVHGFDQPHRIMGIQESAAHLFEACSIANKIKHYRTAATGIM